MLTAAVAAGKSFIDDGYEINKIGKYLDFVNLMSYVITFINISF
jgi:GH18 family chitinase